MANLAVDLTTAQAVADYLGGTWTSPQLAQLGVMVTALSRTCAGYCSRNFIQATYTEVRNGTGTAMIVLRNYPVTAVTAVSVYGDAIPACSAPGKADGFAFDPATGTLYAPSLFTRGMQNVVINYTAGYLPINNASTDIPADLQFSIVEAVADRYKRKNNIGILSQSIAGETVTYGSINVPKSVLEVWKDYRNSAYG